MGFFFFFQSYPLLVGCTLEKLKLCYNTLRKLEQIIINASFRRPSLIFGGYKSAGYFDSTPPPLLTFKLIP